MTLFLQTARRLVDAGSAVLTVGFRKLLAVGVARLGTAATAIVIRRVKLKGRYFFLLFPTFSYFFLLFHTFSYCFTRNH